MRRVIVSNLMPLDGFFEGPNKKLNFGAGNPLFKGIKQTLRLKLQQTKLFASGVVVLYYQKA